jgi:hypothetical protein
LPSGIGLQFGFLEDYDDYFVAPPPGSFTEHTNASDRWFVYDIIDGTVLAKPRLPKDWGFPIFVNGVQQDPIVYFDVVGPVIQGALESTAFTINFFSTMLRPGRFYGTSLDLRSAPKRFGSIESSRAGSYPEGLHAQMLNEADAWQEEVGLVIPPMCREGYMLVRYFGGRTDHLAFGANTPLPAGIEQAGIFPGLGVGRVDFTGLPAEEVNYGPSGEGERWTSIWTSPLDYQFNFGASINAGPSKCGIITDGVYRNEYFFGDVALEAFTGTDIPVLSLPASYLAAVPGIDMTGRTALRTTFVGAV